jgi:hypothetical protein
MAVQKIFSQQIDSGGISNGKVLTANSASNTAYWATPAASGATWAALIATNTAIRALDAQKLQVANAVATYQTKTIERAALANTNLRINLLNTNLTGTNTAIRALDTAKLSVANAVATYLTKSNPIITGTLTANGSVGTAGYYLRTSGAGIYWSPVSGGGGGGSFTGGTVSGATTFSSGVTLSSTLTAGASVGTSGQALVSTGTGVQWGALSPGYNYSSQFNGTNQSLSVPNNALFNFGSGAFTVEFWVYFNSVSGQQCIVTNYGGSTTGWTIQIAAGGAFGANLSGDGFDITGATATVRTWYHVALSGSSGSIKLFVNGTQSGSTFTGAVGLDSSSALTIGTIASSAYLNGFISNLRIIKGTALYTANFTAPTSPLTAISGTSLLTCSSITPTSDASTNVVITNNNGVTTTATLSPFASTTVSIPTQSLTAVRQQFTGDGSTTTFAVAGGYTPNAISVFVNGVMLRNGTEVTVTNGSTVVFAIAPLSGALIDVIGTVPTTYSSITPVSYSTQFNGSSQYLSVADSAILQPGSSNFTLEAWVYPTATATNGSVVISKAATNSFGPFALGFASATYQVQGLSSFNGTTWGARVDGATISPNTWSHIAWVRNGTTFTLYVNGVSSGSVTASGAVYAASTFDLMIGKTNYVSTSFTGYISNARVVIGTAVYTSNFTVPSSPLATVQSAGSNISAITGTQTSLLTCNGPTIIDGSTNAFTITNNGSAPVSTAIVPTFTNVTITNPVTSFLASYLVVAGGGSGGATNVGASSGGGGGGAGGALTGLTTFTVGLTYYITVGAGGASTNLLGNNGVNSQIVNFSTFSIVAIGGGGGGGSTNAATVNGQSGGSGGGGGNINGANAPGGSGTSGQGYAGGTLSGYAAPNYPGAGGGGAGAVGTTVTSATVGGNGGAGLSSSITGTSVTYAGGGGGSTYNGGTPGTGGSGGGGAGATGGTAGTAGTVNTGGGGGGAAQGSYSGAGGSGVVILSIPTANYTGRTTGSPTVTTSGTNTILKFTASGTYTA